jgi:DNA repair protein RadC
VEKMETLLQLVHLEMVVDRSIEAPVHTVRRPADAVSCLAPFLMRRAAEASAVLALSTRLRPIAVGLIGMGKIDEAPVCVAQLLRFALLANAKALILAHNHPSGDPAVNEFDWAITERVVAAAAFLGFDLVDHLIVVEDGSFTSLRTEDEKRFLSPLGKGWSGGVKAAEGGPLYSVR